MGDSVYIIINGKKWGFNHKSGSISSFIRCLRIHGSVGDDRRFTVRILKTKKR